jgi:hypothetical protein
MPFENLESLLKLLLLYSFGNIRFDLNRNKYQAFFDPKLTNILEESKARF